MQKSVTRATTSRAPGRGKYDRSRSADERRREQRRRLLDAAAHVFAEVGWADATVEAVVARAGMSRRTFYLHFDDLSACLRALHQAITRTAFRAIATAVEAEDIPSSMLRVGVHGMLAAIVAFPHTARVLFRVVRSAGPEFEAAHETMMSRFCDLFRAGVQRAWERGEVSRPPDDLRVFALVSAIEAVAMRYVVRGKEKDAMEAAPVLIELAERVLS